MKKLFLTISLLAVTLMAGAQKPVLEDGSVNDVEQADNVQVQEVRAQARRLAGAVAEKTTVDTQSLLNVLNAINTRLAALEARVNGEAPTHDYVEIGGKKWATMNLGATTVAGSYATCAGDFYAWGETTPRYTGISWSDSKASFTGLSMQWSSSYYPSYTDETLDEAHDAVVKSSSWVGGWRTPTKADFVSLAVACSGSNADVQTPKTLSSATPAGGIYWLSETQTYLEEYAGVAGVLFVAKSDTSKRVFFPAVGYGGKSTHYEGGTNGCYWSSSCFMSNTNDAFVLDTYQDNVNLSIHYNRYQGFPIRPVSD